MSQFTRLAIPLTSWSPLASTGRSFPILALSMCGWLECMAIRLICTRASRQWNQHCKIFNTIRIGDGQFHRRRPCDNPLLKISFTPWLLIDHPSRTKSSVRGRAVTFTAKTAVPHYLMGLLYGFLIPQLILGYSTPRHPHFLVHCEVN